MPLVRRVNLPSTCLLGGSPVELTIPAVVAWAAREFGDAEALADPGPGGGRLSYRELGERVTAVAGALVDADVAPGDRVAVWAPNGGQWVLAALGTLRAGGVLVPVSTRFTGPEALDVIERSGARVLFVAEDFLGVDRLAALRAAASRDGGLEGLGLVVRMPGEWDAFVGRGASVPSEVVSERAGAVRPGDVSDI